MKLQAKKVEPKWVEATLYRFQCRQIKPAVEWSGITKLVGWDTFLHTQPRLLKSDLEQMGRVRKILCNANSRITMDT